ncbi:putative isochorismatase family protein YaaI [Halobacillus andaensis]|uniref:Isochorismatase family protein YaaI n=1 Tax=Halobacillus andaensis TaxID=1176239 RepID=A0A917EX30_HALAA|nr:isochorismatase family cysteine hydrolase [Halobacillus andaensis]MBP2005990.1 nicotinamidase-related amidase [Halobacillus andaensis]GGF24483.1 putative isochorismatase family protein YaaI [Halobacillus andaensis]
MAQNTALLIIDMINKMDFNGGEDLLEHSKDIVGPINELRKQAKQNGMPVIYVNDNFNLWQDNVDELIQECKHGPGETIINEVLPEENDYFIIKPKHSGFFGTQLSILLEQLEVKKLILTGVAGDICVLFTANDAYMRDYDLWVPKDCVASEKTSDNDNALQIIKRSLFANIQSTKQTSIEQAFKE